jgi:hypothetical protein
VVNAIRKEEIDKASLLQLDYSAHLWMEKEIKSVANVARRDVREFLQLAADLQLHPEVEEYALEEANRALVDLKQRRIRGAKVLRSVDHAGGGIRGFGENGRGTSRTNSGRWRVRAEVPRGRNLR